jgi:hypothetical protein
MVVVIFCTNVFGQVSAFEQKATSVTLSTSFCGGGVEEEDPDGSDAKGVSYTRFTRNCPAYLGQMLKNKLLTSVFDECK